MSPTLGFETVWRELRPRTIALLVRRGATQDVAEDVAQETAIRLLNNWHLLDRDRPTWPFVRRVALNCLVDRYRREHFDCMEPVPDGIAHFDVEEQSLARFRLTEVWRAMAGLTQKERSILLAEVGITGHHPNTSATKMARRRARQKLTAAVGRSGAFSGIPLAWRRFTGWVQLHGPAYVDVGAAAGLAVIVSAAAVSLGQPGHAAVASGPRSFGSVNISLRRSEPAAARRVAAPAHVRGSSARTEDATPTRPKTLPAEHSHTPQSTPGSTSAQAGPARAETGKNGGATYLQVCTGENTQTPHDDASVTVVIVDGEEPGEEPPDCRHGDQGPEEEGP